MTGQAPRMEGRYVRLRTIDWSVATDTQGWESWPADVRGLYELFTLPQNIWRLGGRTPTPMQFLGGVIEDPLLLCQYVVSPKNDGRVLGYVSAYDPDFTNQHVRIAAVFSPNSLVVGEAIPLLIDALFDQWPFRFLYLDAPEYNAKQFWGKFARQVLTEDGVRAQYFVRGDPAGDGYRTFNLHLYSFARSRGLRLVTRMEAMSASWQKSRRSSRRRDSGMTTATKSLGLLAAVVAGTVPAVPATAADTTATLETRLANKQPLTVADKTFIRDSARSLGVPDRMVDAVFAEYAKGNDKPLLGLPATQETTVTSDAGGAALPSATEAVTVAALATTNPPTGPWNGWNGPFQSPCNPRNIGFTVRRDVHGNFGQRLASFWQHVEAADNCASVWPPNPQNLTIDMTSSAGLGGWSFEGYGPLSRGYSKFNGNNTGSYYWATQAYFKTCVAQVGCYQSWTPSIWSQRYATPGGWGWTMGWGTDADPGMHYL